MAFVPAQAKFRFYNDDGGLTTATPAAAENANLTAPDGSGDKSYQLKFQIQETGGTAGSNNDDWQLQYSKNGGAWTSITTSSSNVKAFDSANLTDASPVSSANSTLSAGSGSFANGKISEDGLLDDFRLSANNYTEFIYTVQTIDADLAAGDTLDFRVLLNGAVLSGGYTVTPRITNQASNITASLTGTLGTLTSSSASTLQINGVVDKTLQTISLAATASLPLHGSLSQTLGTLTVSSASTLPLHGTVDTTLDNTVGSSTASSQVAGNVAATLEALLLSSTATLPITGGLAATFAQLLVSSAGAGTIFAEAAADLVPLAVASNGVLTQRAILEQTLENLALEITTTKPYPFGQIKVYLDGAWRAKPLKVWDGEAWVQKPLKIFDGVDWHVTLY